MAIYGIDFYGIAHYGQAVIFDFDASPFTAINVDYGHVLLNWRAPTGAYDQIRLVRSPAGYPNTETDGEILLTQATAGAQTSYDDFTVVGKKFYYYALFVHATATSTWVLAGATVIIAAYNYGYSTRLFDLLPLVFQSGSATEITSAQTNATLQSFLTIFGFQFDQIRAEYDSLLNLTNPDKIAGGLLPYLAANLGVAYEPSVSQKQARVYVRNSVHNTKIKGTNPGITSLVTSYTGWANVVTRGYNLMLDYNGSSFEESLGRWVVTAATVVLTRGTTTGFAYIDPNFTNKQVGYAVVTSTGATTNATLASGTAANVITEGIPVTAGLAYTVSVLFRSAVTSRTPQVYISWYDKTGAFLSDSTAGTSAATTTTTWTRASSANQTAPANSQYALVRVKYPTLASSEVQYFDGAQLEQSATLSNFQEARDTRIVLVADRINQVTNPNFEVNTTGWQTTGVSTITRDTTQFWRYTASLKIVATSTNSGASTSFISTLKGNTPYVFSMYIRPSVTSVRLTVAMSALSLGPFDFTGLTVNVWQRISVPFTTNATPGTCTVAINSGALSSATYYLDGVMCEQGNILNTYFDGDDATLLGTPDYMWEGTVGNSRSHYYSFRTGKNYRLNQLLPDYTPSGSTFTLLYAQAGT